MPEKPLVSIITPSYNQAQYLQKTITSVLEQDYPEIEYIVIDGGSTDDSQKIIRSFQKRLTWWVSEKDQGQADAINKGLKRAKGQVIAWLNSDDYYMPGAITKAVASLQSNSKVSMVYGDVLAVDAQDNPLNLLRYRQYDLADLMCFNIIGQPSVIFRKKYIELTGYLDVSYQYLLDHHLWLRLAKHAPILYLPSTLSAARFHSQSKNIAQADKFGQEAFRIIDWLQADPEFKNIFLENKKRIWAGAHRFNARYLLDGGQPKAALNAYWQSLCAHPATALREWYRILFALISMLGLGKIKQLHPRWRK